MKRFLDINNHAKAIVWIYKFIGLYSILALTIVTIISMSNVFTAGEFAHYPWLKNTWAFIFAASIDVNIVRLFVESKVDNSRWAFTIGIGLGIVTGAALLIEGLQQSIGLPFTNDYVQWTIAILIGLRVFFVIILMAREGRKLGSLVFTAVHISEQETPPIMPVYEPSQERDTGPIVHPHAGEETRESEQEENTQETPRVNTRKQETGNRKQVGDKSSSVHNVLAGNPNATITEIVNMAKVSRGYASRVRNQYMSEQQSA